MKQDKFNVIGIVKKNYCMENKNKPVFSKKIILNNEKEQLKYPLDCKDIHIMTRDIENEVLVKQIKQLEKKLQKIKHYLKLKKSKF